MRFFYPDNSKKVEDFDFDTWFKLFSEIVLKAGYKGELDKYSFEWNWEGNETPEYAAEQFMSEISA